MKIYETMKYKLDSGAHSVYALQYHLVQCVKYRRQIFDNDGIISLLKQKIMEISDTFHVTVIDIGCDRDHYHMLFRAKPALDIPKYMNAIKTITSREIKRNFPKVKQKLWGEAFWSPSYFLATSGQVMLEQLKRYVDGQGEPDASD
jgi:putative transposase